MIRHLNENQISALSNCCRVAGEKFRDNAKLLECYPSLAEQFIHQADQAFEFGRLLDTAFEAQLLINEEMLDED